MYRKAFACLVVALCLAGGATTAFAAIPPPSPLAKIGINQIKAVADSFDAWIAVVCPIFAEIVDSADEVSPELGDYYADTYSGVVCTVAEQKVAAVNAIANSFVQLLTSPADDLHVNEARNIAIQRINSAKLLCLAILQGQPQAP